jgi:hypothetical protein
MTKWMKDELCKIAESDDLVLNGRGRPLSAEFRSVPGE